MPGKIRTSHRSTGKKIGGASSSAATSGAVTLKTTGKISSTPKSGSGGQTKAPLAKPSPVKDSMSPSKQKGRTVVPKTSGKSA